jgi:peptidoglycan L-alanyl-D-glutamate endopeptidase CwlK
MNWGSFKSSKKPAALTIGALILLTFGYSQRSINNINEVQEPLQVVTVCARQEIKPPLGFIVVDGGRTLTEHKINVANGRSWIKRSRHQDGAAIDFAATLDGKVTYDLQYYYPIVDAFKKCSVIHNVPIVAGIDWKVKDGQHIELNKAYYP